MVDPVEASRRLHTTPRPRLGGLGIAAGLIVGLFVFRARGHLDDLSPDARAPLLTSRVLFDVTIALAAPFLVGLVDDVMPRGRGLPPSVKLLAQIAAAAWMVLRAGAEVDGSSQAPWGAFTLGAWGPVVTAAWIVAVLNVVNFMDGSDAIAGLTAAVILVSAGASEPAAAGATLLPLGCAALGFL